ncbi:hypothetical protein Hypma_015536 [Hypsizygus marmoreus]|uniref:Uncharacterized protein n=1 Tax=Hypsizygus marmoreus TaxID=39966 RepID=A0A369K262_HYPMA|nr:hypothetical protein Hypma_015536 [Hypsizygus marmoreus]
MALNVPTRSDDPHDPNHATSSFISLPAAVEDDMSEQQLRELYEDEEIERFLSLFSVHVKEVRMPEMPSTGQDSQSTLSFDVIHPNDVGSEGPSTLSSPDTSSSVSVTSIPSRFSDRSLSEEIAIQLLMPILPPARPPPPAFTLNRLRLTAQRLYLAVQPLYIPFLCRMADLATWKDMKISSIYCVIYWITWYHNLLLPCLLLCILYSLLRRRIFPYPSLSELRELRYQISRANEFGDQISARLGGSALGVKDMWRILKVLSKTPKNKGRSSAKENGISDSSEDSKDTLPASEDATVLDDSQDAQDVQDLKRLGLHLLSELADFHERIINIFIWRSPPSSCVYGVAVFLLFFVTLCLPAKYLAKLAYFIGGVLFWHITPVIAALPPAEYSRLPPPFHDVPTNAEYAMQLISQRMAAGLAIKPKNKKNGKGHGRTPSVQNSDATPTKSPSVDWKKWGERAAMGKTWASGGERLMSRQQDITEWPPSSSLVSQPAAAIARPGKPAENHTFPAQHTSSPGLITVTDTALFFTPLMSLEPKFVLPLSDIRGVKKVGLLKGLQICIVQTVEGVKQEKEEKFLWVGGRDELFARLMGADGRRWMKV